MMSDHHIIPGWFTPKQWAELQPLVARLASEPGGVLLISVDVNPSRRNCPDVAFASFSPEERLIIQRALANIQRRRVARAQQSKATATNHD
jgi:hypothetical protein